MDYRELAKNQKHDNYQAFLTANKEQNIFALTTKGSKNYTDVSIMPNSILLFGPETRGLPDEVLNSLQAENKLRLPMHPDSRSLNLSNTVAIVTYEALRQNDFKGLS